MDWSHAFGFDPLSSSMLLFLTLLFHRIHFSSTPFPLFLSLQQKCYLFPFCWQTFISPNQGHLQGTQKSRSDRHDCGIEPPSSLTYASMTCEKAKLSLPFSNFSLAGHQSKFLQASSQADIRNGVFAFTLATFSFIEGNNNLILPTGWEQICHLHPDVKQATQPPLH